MKKYRANVIMETDLYLEFEAENEDEAWDIAKDTDGGEFLEDMSGGCWTVTSVEELQ